jgi:hypothetical protein
MERRTTNLQRKLGGADEKFARSRLVHFLTICPQSPSGTRETLVRAKLGSHLSVDNRDSR